MNAPDGDLAREVEMKVHYLVCSCGNRDFILILPREVYCPKCHSVIEQMRWTHDGTPKPALDG